MAEYNLEIVSICPFTAPSDFLDAVKLHNKMLPEYLPMRWGWGETRTTFDINNINQLVHPNGNTETVFWRRTGRDKAFGSWMTPYCRKVEVNTQFRGSINIDVQKSTYQEKLLVYLKTASQCFQAHIGVLDSNVDKNKTLAEFVYKLPSGATCIDSIDAGIDLALIDHWLSDMPWAVVFGSAYVRMFGKERLLSCPAYKVEDIGEEMVFIQLTPSMEDIHQKYDEVIQARAIAKKHLGEECFFKAELAYDYKISAFTSVTEEEIEAKRGKVFRVPKFELKPD